MANYQYQKWFLLIIFILFKQGSILSIAEPIEYESTDTFNSHSTPITASTIPYNNNDGTIYDNEIENNGGDIYDEDDGDFSDSHSYPTTVSQSRLNNNITSNIHEYEDENNSYQDDDDDEETQLYGDTMSVNRPEFNRPEIDSNNKKTVDSQSTFRMPFVSSNLWRDLFSKPIILVGVIGGIVIGMLSAILLVIFLIYRMRKKDEGSYALEEAPRKSPSHAYTRVSSKEFFA